MRNWVHVKKDRGGYFVIVRIDCEDQHGIFYSIRNNIKKY